MTWNTELPNVILISFDSLRSDVAFSGIFPTIEDLRNLGTTFLNTVSSSPLTPASHATIFTGLQPPRHGIRHLFRESLKTGVRTLAEAFRLEGYWTGAIVSCPGLHIWYQLDRGFHIYDDTLPSLPEGVDPLQTVDVKLRGRALKRAEVVMERALAWIDELASFPFFQFVHFFDAHWPYEPPQQFNTQIENPYEGEIAYMDHYLGLYLDQLANRGLLENALLILLSDHGEDLGGWYPSDHAGEALGHPEEQGHGCLLYDATQMVPLIFVWPERILASHTVEAQVSLADVAPTIADLTGLPFPGTHGESLATALRGTTVSHRLGYCETYHPVEQFEATGMFPGLHALKAIRIANRYKIIWEVNGDRIEFYDLLADPNEKNNIWLGR